MIMPVQGDSEIPEMTCELSLFDKLKARVGLARQIDNMQHKVRKSNHDRTWMKETAEALEVDLDSDYLRCVFAIPNLHLPLT